MALNIKDPETVRLANEVAALAGETKTRAVKVALEERHRHLTRRVQRPPSDRLRAFLEGEAWPQVPPEILGVPISRREREEILGYGAEGV